LLAGPLTSDPKLAEIQVAWKAASTERERRLLALDFEQKLRTEKREVCRRAAALGEVGPADFFSQNLTHTKGPAAGNPFVFEPWQRGFELYKRDERGKRIPASGREGS